MLEIRFSFLFLDFLNIYQQNHKVKNFEKLILSM